MSKLFIDEYVNSHEIKNIESLITASDIFKDADLFYVLDSIDSIAGIIGYIKHIRPEMSISDMMINACRTVNKVSTNVVKSKIHQRIRFSTSFMFFKRGPMSKKEFFDKVRNIDIEAYIKYFDENTRRIDMENRTAHYY